jgi:hypothetical protein
MLLLTAGDPEISGALADGIMAVRWNPSDPPAAGHLPFQGRLPEAKPLEPEQARVVSAEMDRQKVAELLRVAMHKEPVDYAHLAYDAEVAYGESLYAPGLLGKIGEKLLVGYALIVLAFEKLFEALGM